MPNLRHFKLYVQLNKNKKHFRGIYIYIFFFTFCVCFGFALCSDHWGKEIISRFDSDIMSDETVYTDANGREMVQRK